MGAEKSYFEYVWTVEEMTLTLCWEVFIIFWEVGAGFGITVQLQNDYNYDLLIIVNPFISGNNIHVYVNFRYAVLKVLIWYKRNLIIFIRLSTSNTNEGQR